MTDKAVVDGETLNGVPLTTPLKNFRFTNSHFKNMTFEHTVEHVRFEDCTFDNVIFKHLSATIFQRCTLTKVTTPSYLRNLTLVGCELKQCQFIGHQFQYLKLTKTEFDHCTFKTAVFDTFQMDRCVFRRCILQFMKWKEGTIVRTWVDQCMMNHAQIIRCVLSRCKFRASNLNMTKFGFTTLTLVTFRKGSCRRSHWTGGRCTDCTWKQLKLDKGRWVGIECQTCTLQQVSMVEFEARKCQFFDMRLLHVQWLRGRLTGVDFIALVEHDTSFQDTCFTNVDKQPCPTRHGRVLLKKEATEVLITPYVHGRALPMKTPCWTQGQRFELLVSQTPDFLEVKQPTSWFPYSSNPSVYALVKLVKVGAVRYYYTKRYRLLDGGIKEGYRRAPMIKRRHSF